MRLLRSRLTGTLHRRLAAFAQGFLVAATYAPAIAGLIACPLAFAAPSAADGVVIPVTGSRGMAFDATGSVLYISRGPRTIFDLSAIERFEIGSGQLLEPIVMGIDPAAMDLSLDGRFLYVADRRSQSNLSGGTIRKLDLETGVVSDVTYDPVSREGRAVDIKIGALGKGLIMTDEGSCCAFTPIRFIDTLGDQVSVTGREVSPGGRVYRGADRSLLLAIESRTSSPDMFVYDAILDTLSRPFDLFVESPRAAAVNRDGTLVAAYMSSGVIRVFDRHLSTLQVLDYPFTAALIFDAKRDLLYAVNAASDELITIETQTFTEISRQPIGMNIPLFAAESDAMAASEDGRFLALREQQEVILFFVGETLQVDVDVRPGSDLNPINPASQGVIPVAILGSEDFDPRDVDVDALAFGDGGAPPLHREGGHWIDVNRDGHTDLLSHYRIAETGTAPGDSEACVTGELLDGTPFEGCDSILVVGPCGLGFEVVLVLPVLAVMRRRARSWASGPGPSGSADGLAGSGSSPAARIQAASRR